MSSKTERVIIAAAGIVGGSATGMIGPVIAAAVVDYAAEKLEQRAGQKKK